MSSDVIRIVVCGDDAVGKSSLIAALLKEEFVPNIQRVIPPVTISREDYAANANDFISENEIPVKESKGKKGSADSTTYSASTSIKADSDLYSNGSVNVLKYIPKSSVIVDTNSSDTAQLQKELKRADAIWLVYSDHYTYERISLYWLLMFRSMGVSLPIVLCANKSDILDSSSGTAKQQNADEFIPLINDFKEIEACIRCSAKLNYNVSEAFYLCERAITHPISPIFDPKEGLLKPACVTALKRVFFLCDKDQDGFLDYEEFSKLHTKCFGVPSSPREFKKILNTIGKVILPADKGPEKEKKPDDTVVPTPRRRSTSSSISVHASSSSSGQEGKISEDGFILLNKIYAERGRHETIWGILRAFQYTNSLSLQDKFLFPHLDVPRNSSVELGPIGYRFLVDLFLKFDKDNDGGLNEPELNSLFLPTPGIPKLWQESQFPSSIVRNEEGFVSLQGWLAQWSLTTFLDHKTTLEYLAYLGFDDYETLSIKALKVTKQRKTRQKQGKTYRQSVNDRNVFNCFILGAPKSGKTSLLELFLKGSFSETYSPTIKPRLCVKDIELRGGKQCYLILEELGELEPAILENKERLNQCDVICYVYDSSDPDSFQYLVDLREKYSNKYRNHHASSDNKGLIVNINSNDTNGITNNHHSPSNGVINNILDEIPSVFVALKADEDKQQQRSDVQPENYTRDLFLSPPMHVSSTWPSSIHELFIQLVDAAKTPSIATPGLETEPDDTDTENLKHLVLAGGAITVMTLVSIWIWKSSLQSARG